MSEPLVPSPGTRLEQLIRRYVELRPKADELAERLKEVKDGIKAEMAAARPGERSITLVSPLLEKPLKLTAKDSWRLDTTKLKKEQPAMYAYYAQQSTSWELRQ